MPALSRRRFLKISTAALFAAGAAGRLVSAATTAATRPALGVRRVPTFCDICFWKCNAIASVRDGQLWKIEGNPNDPLSRGRLCPRGTGGIGAHTDPDRLRTPLIRTRERGAEEWKAVTWDEALDYVAARMKKIAAEHGPESMALFAHGIGGTFLKHAFKAYGSPNIAAPSFAQCRGPRDVGFNLTFGEEVGSPERTDIANAECLVLIGSHLGENMHNTQVQEFADAVGRGTRLIVVDPRFSVAASKAAHYLPIRPGTDLALLLAWMQVIVTEKLYDADYVTRHGHGFDAFAASLASYTPEWAFPETGIDPETIRVTAREMARHRPATLVHPGRHVNWNGDDAQRSRAIALLNALLGSWGHKGGFYTPASMDVAAYPYPAYPKSTKPKVDNPGRKYPFAHEAITTGIREATLTGQPYPIKGWMVYATNLLQALPNEAETIRAIQQLDLLVVVDVIPSEIAGWADVVLPETTYLERYDDLNVELFKEPFVALRQPVVEPPHDQKPNWWIAKKLADKLGLGAFFPWQDIEQYLETRLRSAGLSLAQLQREGLIRGPRQPIYFDDGVPAEFPTPSGKIEFYSHQLADAGFDPVPRYTPPEPAPPGTFRLLFGRAPMHSFSRTHTNRLLSDLMSENAVWLNAVAARRLGLKTGDRVRLRNQDGMLSNTVLVKATPRIRPDCVFLVHGFGHTARGLRHAFGKGASDAQLITRYKTDPLMGGTAMNVNFVTLEPAEAV
ncbi:molybdopterin-containing oxidoreductase family protein [Opitutus terrae]|uniref:Molybdopterin oxidoreductase n=1 Tax=Opitutus terrae (strain DSM 11246 / JCM 15787 / PB90-1) TaxID=452637 RepID=B1ZSQ1_OPITP|nr:molybdopterin-dependent oxidoreductase [Opitutus terrae]ACB74750.1 molybdopterin oxidoreductase [Opitutus terrae PB90-1]